MYYKFILAIISLVLTFVGYTMAQVTVTAGANGTLQNADRASTGIGSNPQWATLGTIRILEANTTAGRQSFGPNQTNATLILTIPTGYEFNPGVGSITYVAGRNITAATLAISSNTITITFSTNNNSPASTDDMRIAGIQVRPTTNISIPVSGNIRRLSSNPGTAIINGITLNSTNFGSLSKQLGVTITRTTTAAALSADRASNSTTPVWTTLGTIRIQEVNNLYGRRSFHPSQNNVTFILTAPPNRSFRPGVGSLSYQASRGISSASIAVSSATITVTLSTNTNTTRTDRLDITGIQVRADNGSLNFPAGQLKRLSSNPGTAKIDGTIRADTIDQRYASLGQIVGVINRLVITLPGQTFFAGSGNSGTPLTQIPGQNFVVPSITATDQHFNIITSYIGNKTLNWLNPLLGTGSFVTSVNFTNGSSTTQLNTTIWQEQNTTLTVRQSTSYGYASSILPVWYPGVITIGSPNTLLFTGIQASSQEETYNIYFNNNAGLYFYVDDQKGSDNGYYTTIQCSNLINNTHSISNSQISLKTSGIVDLLSGSANSDVISLLGNTYQPCNNILSFIRRNTGSNAQRTGRYGQYIDMQIIVPAWQSPGNYTGNITFTLIEN